MTLPVLPRAPRAAVDVVVADRGARVAPAPQIVVSPPRPWWMPARPTPVRGSRDHLRDPNGEPNGI